MDSEEGHNSGKLRPTEYVEGEVGVVGGHLRMNAAGHAASAMSASAETTTRSNAEGVRHGELEGHLGGRGSPGDPAAAASAGTGDGGGSWGSETVLRPVPFLVEIGFASYDDQNPDADDLPTAEVEVDDSRRQLELHEARQRDRRNHQNNTSSSNNRKITEKVRGRPPDGGACKIGHHLLRAEDQVSPAGRTHSDQASLAGRIRSNPRPGAYRVYPCGPPPADAEDITDDEETRSGIAPLFGGASYGGEDRELTVAVAVHENENVSIPSAVHYDPDVKPPVYRDGRFHFYTLLVFFLLVAVAAGVTIGVVLSNKGSNNWLTVTPTSYRENLGIKQVIGQVIGSDALVDPKSPYSKALNWILFDDPMNVTSANSNLVQRFIAAYLYYATTEQQPWLSCNPPQSGEDSSCTFQKLINIGPVEFQDTPWIRWLSNQHECLWAGVLCDDFQQIRGLDLSGANMTGGYPDGLKYFTYLQSLTLVLGQLEGTIPDDWSDYKHLVDLELRYNLLSGTIPVGLWQSRVLEHVYLSSNRLKGSIPAEIKEVTDMKGLYLYENQLTGTIPTELGLLRNIAYICVNRNAFKGTIPSEIGNLKGLYWLRISENSLTGALPSELGMLTALVDFKVFSNPMLGGTLPDSIYVPSINHFDLSGCNFVGTISSAIANMAALLSFNIANNHFNGTISSAIASMTSLQDFDVANNHFNGTIPALFGLFDSLVSLKLSGNNFSGSMPAAVCTLRKQVFPTLTDLTADCTPDPVSGRAQINCTSTCCTLCCNAAGTPCVLTHGKLT